MAKVRNVGEGLTVNDGKGLLDNEGLIDSLIVDCNTAVKQLVDGNYIAWCNINVQMVQKLANLKVGVRNDMKSLQDQLEELKRMLDGGAKDGNS